MLVGNMGADRAVRRALLMASSASFCFAGAGVANAQSVAALAGNFDAVTLESQSASASAYSLSSGLTGDYLAPQIAKIAATDPLPQITATAPVSQIVVADPGTPTTAVDPTDITGVGQMVADIGGGFIGLCTATLINPRTVIFAAHCVNDEAASNYGAASGGTPIGFGFSSYNLPGIRSWYLSGPGQYQTNTDLAFYNANYVSYNPGSLEPDAQSFLYSDVAVASLDTPAANIPTWALMFSALPDPGEIGADGTGYHVVIDGYGRNGTGTTGSGSIDYRRRIAENMLGALTSLDTFESFLFGQPNGLYQNLYFLDFDDPARGTAGASPYDFNAFRDNATSHEGTTASGDSGGPLILDNTYQIPLVIGVLSGGYTRFFNDQPANGYGTVSFYQPLYLYWDWISANNPYHYVSAKAGNGAWEDASHWVTTLDPNYWVLNSDGVLVNGIPTTPGEGKTGSDGQFGQTCYQTTGLNDCYDIATGTETVSGDPIGTAGNDRGTVAFAEGSTSGTSVGTQVVETTSGLPDPTLSNGLPGATGFVPDNYDGDRLAGEAPRYFDVTLAAAGTTTLSSAVTVDRFTIANADAALDIKVGASLTSLIDVTQGSGMLRVDGTLTSVGDYLMLSGGLQGSGTINAPYFTSMAGVISPGGIGSTGTLTFNGNVILASGTTYLVDLGNSGTSDLIAVKATAYSTDGGEQAPTGITTQAVAASGTPLDGMASIGGLVAFGAASGVTVRDGNTYTILTAEGGYDGTFTSAGPISAILTPVLSYGANAVTVQIKAGTYASVVDTASPIQTAFAQLLDQNRAQYGAYADLYGPLDIMSQGQIKATLEGFAPREQPLMQSMGTAALDTTNRFIRERMATIGSGNSGGTLALYGRPLQLAQAAVNTPVMGNEVATDAAAAPVIAENALPDDTSAFLAGGYINGHSLGAPTAIPYARDEFDGWFIAGGIEKAFAANGAAGFAFSYTDMTGQPGYPTRSVKGNLFQVTFYAVNRFDNGLQLDGQMSAGSYSVDTSRTVSAGTSSYKLDASSHPFTFSAEAGLSRAYGGSMFEITPRIAARYAHIGFTNMAETGGGPALQYRLGSYDSLQGRAGLSLAGKGKISPFLNATYVHDFKDKPAAFGANFVGGIGPNALFALPGSDQNWAELAVGISTKGPVSLSVSAETTAWREDVSYQSYRAALTIKF